MLSTYQTHHSTNRHRASIYEATDYQGSWEQQALPDNGHCETDLDDLLSNV